MDLKILSGLPLLLEDDKIVLSGQAVSLPAAYRRLDEARPYFKDKDAGFSSDYLYAMHRGVHLKEDENLFKEYGLRYDITQILPGLIGEEFIKTIGHYHKDSSSEIYEVLHGEALFLFQEVSGGEIYLIKAEIGEKVVIPLGYGHITVNCGNNYLVVADVSSIDMEPDYDFFKKYGGAAYHIVKNNGDIKAIKNENYSSVKELKIGKPKEVPALNVSFSKPLYSSFVENPQNFEFIRHSENYKEILAPEKLFEFSA